MDEETRSQQTRHEPPAVAPVQPKDAPPSGAEPEEEGGEAPCWAHLLDEDGRLD